MNMSLSLPIFTKLKLLGKLELHVFINGMINWLVLLIHGR